MSADQDFRYPSLTTRRDNISSPLIVSSNGHPSYHPFKLNIKTATDLKANKVKLPEKPMAPYMRFSKKVFDQVKMANADMKQWEIGCIIQQMWKDLSDSEKQEYINEYENSKFEYSEQLKLFHNSPQYQSFLSSTSKKSKNANGASNISNLVSNNPTLVSLSSKSNDLVNTGTIYSTALSHYAIEPAEDDGIDESLSQKTQASIRFQRNHRLLNDIFNEFCVQDSRSIVTQQRMEQLRKQVASLETHQEKLKQELVQIQEKYESKKRKFLSLSQDFDKEMIKLKENKITDEQQNQFFSKHYELIQKQWKDYTDNFATLMANKNVTKESAQNLLREGLENLINNANSTKSLMTISNPTAISVVALQQPVEAPATNSTPNGTGQNEPQSNPQQTSQSNHNEPSRPSNNNQNANSSMAAHSRFPLSNTPSAMPRPSIPANMAHNQVSYMNQNQFNSQQFRSTNTPPLSSANSAIISPNNQASIQQSSSQTGQTMQSQMPTQPSHSVQSPANNRIAQQIRPQGPVQPMSNQAQMMQSHPMPQMNTNVNMNPNMNYYHQPQMPMNQMHMYNSVNMVQTPAHLPQQGNQQVSGQSQSQQASQFNTNINMMQQQIAQPINYQGQIQSGQQLPPPPQYPNSMHQQMPPQMQGPIMYGQHPQQQNISMYNQAGQSQQQMMMMQQQQFGNMYQQMQSNQSQNQSQSNQIIANQFVNQQNAHQQSQVNSPQAKVEKKMKEDKQKKKSKQKSASNE
ncbi:SWI SNF-related matrix-associated actin-dependent regulator of chromatin subfamily E member [Brachionus plicatilis]|uniref:SWI SNF-related matrix-associated actin-dependent regulator of chromatin subfamily E member n=1 Tax=Brachionus plicatilis TaxID=10195 RepID=A0A3M7RMP4_BRAPC|nr:SWI SNF-related matrix-associated actin-dependent regulator of chromatin subfamily E member [Brachionus plicatilis]